jgi:hypothetical protein
MSTTPQISVDLQALKADIAKLSPEKMAEELLRIQTRKKKQQLKHQGSDQQKKYQAKQRAKFNLMKAQALETPATEKNPDTGKLFGSLWEQINYAATAKAEEEAASEVTEPEEEE